MLGLLRPTTKRMAVMVALSRARTTAGLLVVAAVLRIKAGPILAARHLQEVGRLLGFVVALVVLRSCTRRAGSTTSAAPVVAVAHGGVGALGATGNRTATLR